MDKLPKYLVTLTACGGVREERCAQITMSVGI